MDTAQTRTLRRALEACGNTETLAENLGVSTDALATWMKGLEALPARVYFDALDIVARGPLQQVLRRIV